MFHQANLRAYDGDHSLLGDLLDWTLDQAARRACACRCARRDGT